MSTTLKSHKALLTRYCNSLERLLENNDGALNLEVQALHDKKISTHVHSVALQLHSTSQLVQEAVNAFTAAIDCVDTSLSEEQEIQVEQYLERAHTLLEKARTAAIQMDCKRLSARDHSQSSYDSNVQRSEDSGPIEVGVGPVRLPTIPIPSFSGKIWDFPNFWTLFYENVHKQPLTKLQKFNYLLSALQGEAREAIRRYPVTEDNYDHAVELLRSRYGDDSKFTAWLQTRLESVKSEKNTIPAQRRLLESIIPLVTQLEERGVSLNGAFLVQKILSKFSIELQKKVLQKLMSSTRDRHTWTIMEVLSELDEILLIEERLDEMVCSNSTFDVGATADSKRYTLKQIPSGSVQCIFCGNTDHKSVMCRKYPTLQERRAALRENNKCLNCGIGGHWVKDCARSGCNKCKGKKHHYTLCPQRRPSMDTATMSPRLKKEQEPPPTKRSAASGTEKPLGRAKQAQTVVIDTSAGAATATTSYANEDHLGAVVSNINNEPLFSDSGSESHPARNNVVLLTGIAKVKDPSQNLWKDIEVLLDTGADQSFITCRLAKELGLEDAARIELKMFTFGREDATSSTCGITTLELWDQEGTKHQLRLLTTPVLTAECRTAQLCAEDMSYIAQHKIQLSKKNCETPSRPQILLGCDQLWGLLDVSYPRHTLPSGLRLIPSKLGYLLTGRQVVAPEQDLHREDVDSCTMTTVHSFGNIDEELKRWDKYWTMDSAGVCEFTGTKKAEKDAVNEQVAKFFEDTIEKRHDGYYIRFPYKKDHPPLPSNKVIALKRLRVVLDTLQKTPQLLRDYDETFKAQREKGIIEEVRDSLLVEGALVHYIPHQPVVTPQKETTKLRIVFDASAHYKDSPSLNDVLHQGPLILPELYAMLLRFRMPKFVIISDVEKAFLQVRLHEADRDATRFFWVRDIDAPLDEQNLVTFRFTRVTFGLNVSPYLLGGTIHHHLRCAVTNTKLADEIRENLYVDNLILSAESSKEAIQKSLETRQIFDDMGMNLREFLSNDIMLRHCIPETARAKTSKQKVLGIQWNAETDSLSVDISFLTSEHVTKRTVARQIASIYDPLGWLVPLLIPAKKFQQDLWRQKFEWDAQLPTNVCNQWAKIVENIIGFHKSFPRRLCDNSVGKNLAVFADASEIAICACAYLFDNNSASLVMAKSKLPSIKAKTTMPKLEMNALTLALRLAFSVTEALKSRLPSYPWTIYVFSDSQIALNWLCSKNSTSPGVLVENRLREIRRIVNQLNRDLVSVMFGYVSTSENTSDAGTRGLTKMQLIDHSWWNGPPFLQTPVELWPTTFYRLAMNESLLPNIEAEPNDENTTTVNAVSSNDANVGELLDWSRYSCFSKGKRITALLLRFVKRILRPLTEVRRALIFAHIPELENISNSPGPLNGEEIRAARLALIRNHQCVHLRNEYRKSMENTLRLFKDVNQIWRLKGRLDLSALNDEAKNPVFIATNTVLAQLIIKEAHGRYHNGTEHTMATVREKYWIPKLRQQVRKILTRCVKCRRFNALPYHYPDTTNLPQRRVLKCRPFQHIGLDFFDLPPCVENGDKTKLYGCIFTCTVTRLIHLEVVRNLTTVEFLNALRRFTGRRGIPESITCDNAPTFLHSADILKSAGNVIKVDIHRNLADNEICWHNITPYAPWQGGFYERLIKSVKHALYKALRGTGQRSFDDIHTFIVEVEACLNSRPLTYQGTSHEDMSSIRPIDFLQKDVKLTLAFPAENSSEDDPDYLPHEEMRMLQHRQQVLEAVQSSCKATERFWDVWQQHYLTSLRETHKKLTTTHRLGRELPHVYDVVLVSDPILPRNEWKMARIINTKQGTDGKIREVELITSTKRKIRRPVNLLIPLEIQDRKRHAQLTTNEDDSGQMERNFSKEKNNYNLRPRKPVRYVNNTASTEGTSKRPSKWFLFYIMLLSIFQPVFSDSLPMTYASDRVVTRGPNVTEFEIYAESCKYQYFFQDPHVVRFPPKMNDYEVVLKWQCFQKHKHYLSWSRLTLRILQTMDALRRELHEKTQLLSSMRQKLADNKEEIATLRQKLSDKTKDYELLRSAIPPLPSPDRLHRNIINYCHDVYASIKKMTQLDNRIRALSHSKEDWDVRHYELSTPELTCDKLRLEFLFERSQLRILFSAPELLIATRKMERQVWISWMTTPQLNEDGDPLLTKPNHLELAINDQLQLLDNKRSTLSELRASITAESHQQARTLQQRISDTMGSLQSSLEDSLQAMKERIDALVNAYENNTTRKASDRGSEVDEDNAPAADDSPIRRNENDIILNNVDYLEVVDEGHEQIAQAPENSEARRQEIQQEIRQMEQARDNLREIIDDLRRRPTCPPRRFGRGAIDRQEEQYMRCAFCNAEGQHYSDKCLWIRFPQRRRRFIALRGKCEQCLETCRGDRHCPKYTTRCHHCRQHGHHSALCDLPERSEEIAERLGRARERIEDVEERLAILEEQLRNIRD